MKMKYHKHFLSKVLLAIVVLNLNINIEVDMKGIIEMSGSKIVWDIQNQFHLKQEIKQLIKGDEEGGLNKRKSKVNTRSNPKRLVIVKKTITKSVNKPKYSHVKETDLQVALRTENQILKLSSPIKPVVNQNEKASELNRNKSQVFYLI